MPLRIVYVSRGCLTEQSNLLDLSFELYLNVHYWVKDIAVKVT